MQKRKRLLFILLLLLRFFILSFPLLFNDSSGNTVQIPNAILGYPSSAIGCFLQYTNLLQ